MPFIVCHLSKFLQQLTALIYIRRVRKNDSKFWILEMQACPRGLHILFTFLSGDPGRKYFCYTSTQLCIQASLNLRRSVFKLRICSNNTIPVQRNTCIRYSMLLFLIISLVINQNVSKQVTHQFVAVWWKWTFPWTMNFIDSFISELLVS